MKLNARSIVLTLFIMGWSALAVAEDLELKGITVDVKADCDKLNSLEMRSGTFQGRGPGDECVGWQHSNYENTFLGHKVFYAITQNPDGTIVRVAVGKPLSGGRDYWSYNEAKVALTEKFGAPVVSQSTVSNAFGGSFPQERCVWKKGGKMLVLQKHGSKLNEPLLFLVGKTPLEERDTGNKDDL